MKFDLVIKNGNVVIENTVEQLDIGILRGKITEISKEIAGESAEIIDAAHQYVMPGMIDAHVHICEPGRTEWEGFVTGTQALAAGGTTTFVDMPLNALPATTTKSSLHLKLRSAENKAYVDYALYGGLVPDNLQDLEDLSNEGVWLSNVLWQHVAVRKLEILKMLMISLYIKV